MSSFHVTINTDNAAFEDVLPLELSRILFELSEREDLDTAGSILDYNGNTVGSWVWNV